MFVLQNLAKQQRFLQKGFLVCPLEPCLSASDDQDSQVAIGWQVALQA
jgi:hypothetical protein